MPPWAHCGTERFRQPAATFAHLIDVR